MTECTSEQQGTKCTGDFHATHVLTVKPPEPPDIDALFVFKWIAERILIISVVGLLFIGSLVALVTGNQSEDEKPIPRGQMFALSLFGIIVIALMMAYAMSKYDFNPFFICFLSAFLGLGTSKVSYWMLAIWRKSTGFVSFFTIVGKIYKASQKVLTEDEQTPPPHE